MSTAPHRGWFDRPIRMIETNPVFDRLATPIGLVADLLGEGRLTSVLRGEQLGHALHPMLTDIPIGCWTSAAVLDAALHHETELPIKEHFTDTHGYTELIFGLFELESRIFSPRIRDLPSQILYPMEREHRRGTLGPLFRGPRINRAHIRANWDEMHRIAASLQDGTVTAQLLVSKLQAFKNWGGSSRRSQRCIISATRIIAGASTTRLIRASCCMPWRARYSSGSKDCSANVIT